MGTKEKDWLINPEAEGKLTAVLGTNGRLKISNKDLEANFKEKSELLMKMTLQGYTLPQIAEKLYISEEDVFTLAEIIGRKRRNIVPDKVI